MRADPKRDHADLLIALELLIAAVLYLLPFRNFVGFDQDEGLVLSAAERILRGQIPYRDFFSFVTPASPYLMALWFRIFGSTVPVARTVLLVSSGISAALTYLLARRIGSRSAALFAAVFLAVGIMPVRLIALHNWDSTFSALLAVYCAHRLIEARSQRWAFLLGLASALTCLTEQSRGAGLLLAFVLAALVLCLPRRNRVHLPVSALISGALGLFLPFALVFAYFALHHAARLMLEAWLWPLHHYSLVNRVPYGYVITAPDALRQLFTAGPWFGRFVAVFFTVHYLGAAAVCPCLHRPCCCTPPR